MDVVQQFAQYVLDGYIRKRAFEILAKAPMTATRIATEIGPHKSGGRKQGASPLDKGCRATHRSSVSRAIQDLAEHRLVLLLPKNVSTRSNFYKLTKLGDRVFVRLKEMGVLA